MSGRTNGHITPDGDNWNVKKEGASRASKTFENKSDAVGYGRDIAQKQDLGQLIIHKMDGTTQAEDKYGKDPFPPKGEKGKNMLGKYGYCENFRGRDCDPRVVYAFSAHPVGADGKIYMKPSTEAAIIPYDKICGRCPHFKERAS